MSRGFSRGNCMLKQKIAIEFVYSGQQKIKDFEFKFKDDNGKLWMKAITVLFLR